MGGIKLDLYTHLTQIFNRIILHHKFDAYEKFEEISQLIKKTYLKIQDPKRDVNAELNPEAKEHQHHLEVIEQCRLLLAQELAIKKEDQDKYVDKQPSTKINDVINEMAMFEQAGISFGEEEHFRLFHSISRLAKISGATELRFWGKIDCSQHDYFIIEGELPDQEEIEIPKQIEVRGQGVNKKVYWVTDSILEDWVQLPDSNPVHIQAAQYFKHILTGNLNASVNTNPPFPGRESHLLRAQIARIAHTCTIVPNGMYTESDDEENKQLVITEDYSVPGIGELGTNENWSHFFPILLQAGRVTH